jgi:hypothetical protein
MVRRSLLWIQLIAMMEIQITEMDVAVLELLRQDGREVVDQQLRLIFVSKYAEMALLSFQQTDTATIEIQQIMMDAVPLVRLKLDGRAF